MPDTAVTESISIYDALVDPSASDSAHGVLVQMVGHNQRVLEFGCAAGHVTKVLAARGCTVTGVEIDPAAAAAAERYAERVVVGDADGEEVWSQLGDASFDVLAFGDVLEHMRDPLAVLRRAVRLLSPGGFVVVSLPNVAHGDLRLALLSGRFEYRSTGLLDATHLRFFTYDSVIALLRQAGLSPVDLRRIVVPLFATEMGVRREDVQPAVIEQLLADPEAETYQFVVKAVVDGGDEALRQAMLRLRTLDDVQTRMDVKVGVLQAQIDGLQRTVRETQVALSQATARIKQIDASRTMRWSEPARRVVHRARSIRRRD